jgi:F-type H+-transporting ATPase subunit b
MNVLLLAAEEVHTQAENSWLPATDEIVWGGLAFLIIAYMLWKFALPAIKKMMNDRTERIQREIDRAESARRDAEAGAARIQSGLTNIDAETARLVADAADAAVVMEQEGRVRIDNEVAEHLAAAETDLEQARRSAGADMQHQVARLALEATDLIIERELTAQAQQDLIESFISKVGATA